MIINLQCLAGPFDCPACGTPAIPIVYCDPTPFFTSLAKRNIVVLENMACATGRSIVPGWECNKCWARFGEMLTKEQWNNYMDLMNEPRLFQ